MTRPTVTGISTFIQLREASAPRDYVLQVSLDGSTLKLQDDGTVFVLNRLGEPVAGFRAPSATDASGQSIPLNYAIDSEKLRVTIGSGSGGASLPIVAELPVAPTGDLGRWATFAPGHTVAPDKIGEGALRVTQGDKVADGCDFSGSSTTLPGSAIEQRELAYRGGNCQMLVETGTPPPEVVEDSLSTAPTDGTDRHSRDDPAAAAAPASSGNSVLRPRLMAVAARPYRRNVGSYKSIYEDPINLDVSWVRAQTDWHWGNGCVHNPVRNSGRYYWLDDTGWEVRDAPENIRSASCRHSLSHQTNANFRNRYFCSVTMGGGQTYSPDYTVYTRTIVGGQPDGTMNVSWAARKSGPCADLLHYSHIRINDRK